MTSQTITINVLPWKPTPWNPADHSGKARQALHDLAAARRQGVPPADLTGLWYAAACPPEHVIDRAMVRTYHSDTLGAVTIPEE